MSQRKINAAIQRFTDSHWGIEPTRIYDVRDPRLPSHLSEMGKLHEFEVRPLGPDGRFARQIVTLAVPHVAQNILAFSFEEGKVGDHDAFERLFPVLSPVTMSKLAARYTVDEPDLWFKLPAVAKQVGGRQNQWGYPPIPVQVLGAAESVIYYTRKNGDREERAGIEYTHKLGEEGGIKPWLCIAEDGSLWLAGGDYTVPHEGITD